MPSFSTPAAMMAANKKSKQALNKLKYSDWDNEKSLGSNLYNLIANQFYWFGGAAALLCIVAFAFIFGLSLRALILSALPADKFVDAYNALHPNTTMQKDGIDIPHINDTFPIMQRITVVARHSINEQAHRLFPRGFTSPSPNELLINSIGFGIPALMFFFMRMLNSVWVLRTMHPEDYLMIPTFGFFLGMLVLINVAAPFATNLYPAAEEAQIMADPTDVADRVYGSKLVIGLEQCMMMTTWGVKLCIWYYLNRLCRQLPMFLKALQILLVYIIVGFITIEVCYFFVLCRPFSQYWAMPVSNTQCATYAHYSIIQMVFNISSDAALIFIPCWMFQMSRLSMKRKALLSIVFSLAFFTITAAILNKVFNFLSPWTTTYQIWYIREAGVSQIVGNLICCWQLFQRLFKLKSFDERSHEIVAQPEMARRGHLGDLASFTIGGSPKNNLWFNRKKETREHLGSFSYPAKEMTEMNTMVGSQSTSDGSHLTGSTLAERGPSAEPQIPVTLMSFGNDLQPVFNYRRKNNIV